jgi:hypothetical protein
VKGEPLKVTERLPLAKFIGETQNFVSFYIVTQNFTREIVKAAHKSKLTSVTKFGRE